MKYVLAVVIILLSAAPARADFFYKLVGYQCDPKADTLILTYTGALNEAGRKMVKQKGPRQWDPWSLIVKTKDGNSVLSEKTVNGQCTLSDGLYDIAIGPQPGNANLQGMCGGFMTAWAEVKRGAETILGRQTFEFGDCHASEPITTKIVIRAGGKAPVVTKVPPDEFVR
jgi:hypothetical protein